MKNAILFLGMTFAITSVSTSSAMDYARDVVAMSIIPSHIKNIDAKEALRRAQIFLKIDNHDLVEQIHGPQNSYLTRINQSETANDWILASPALKQWARERLLLLDQPVRQQINNKTQQIKAITPAEKAMVHKRIDWCLQRLAETMSPHAAPVFIRSAKRNAARILLPATATAVIGTALVYAIYKIKKKREAQNLPRKTNAVITQKGSF